MTSALLGIVLDRDGVLTTMDRARFARDVLSAIPLPEQEIALRWKAWLGGRALSDAGDEEDVIASFLAGLADDLALAEVQRRALLSIDYLACVRGYDDAKPALADARRSGLRIAVLTNNSAALAPTRQLERVGLDGLVDVALTSQMIGARKPEPAAYLAAAEALRLSPAQCLFFDDTAAWVDGARAVGMAAWQVDRTRRDHDLEAGVVRDLSALPRILARNARS